MSYTHDLLKYARELSEPVTIDYINGKYKVWINNVWYKEKATYFKKAIDGYGFTIEDACCDYLRKCRGQMLIHAVNNCSVSPV